MALTEAPADMAPVWFVGHHIEAPTLQHWRGNDWQQRWLKQGRYFATQAEAQEFRNANPLD